MAATDSDGAAALRASAVAYLLLVQLAASVPVQREPYSLLEAISGEFSGEQFNAVWVNGTTLFYNSDGEMVVTDVSTNETRVVVPRSVMEELGPDSTQLSVDQKFVLIGYDARKVYRHSLTELFVVYNVETGVKTPIGSGERLQLARWSPADNALAFVFANNIYYLSQPDSEQVQITTDGVPGVVYNGVADWVNEEEVLSTDAALWWSPDGTKLAYARYDDTLVRNASFIHYGTPGALADQYAQVLTIRYPKPGTPNPTVQLKVATLPTGSSSLVTAQMMAPTNVGEDNILEAVRWADSSNLLASWTNRVSNVKQFVTFTVTDNSSPNTGKSGFVQTQSDGWLEPKAAVFREGNTTTYATIAWVAQDGAGSFPHVVGVTDDASIPLTSGETAVTSIYGWAANGTLYYQATVAGQPSRRQVYAVEEGGSPRCLSCHVTSPESLYCQYSSASFSKDFSWYAHTCSGPSPSFVTLQAADDPNGTVSTWLDNAELREKLASKLAPKSLDDWLDVAGGMRAQVRLWLPHDLDTSGSERRPAIVYVYAGPGSQQISDSFEVSLMNFLTTTRRYIYVLIDGRGSDCKGSQTLFSLYRRLGTIEIQDQINVTRQLQEKYSFIDGSRTAIWGWSYGGYATAMSLAQDTDDVFQCGVSVAPVSSWIYYDSVYTERYMGLPTSDDNEAGYNNSDVTRLAGRLANKTFFLIHGTGDDNVHYQQSMMLARALEDEGVLFRQLSYPDQDHGLPDMHSHLYRSMDEFFAECFYNSPVSSASRIAGGLLVLASIGTFLL